jgi:23S rRNA pseudouridine2605 synthase
MAHAGLGSRRSCEELIIQGRVSVDGQVVRQLGTRVDATQARIAVDGEPIRLETIVYYAVNKPKGYVSTNFDPAGRPRVVDLLPELPERVYTVGRLDEDSTGLMILTNDGDLANRLAHPRFGVEKLYRALVAGLPSPETLAKLTEGIWLSDGKVRAKRARIVGRQGHATQLELVLAEGKKREIRRMLSKLGHKVMSLNRIAVGPIGLRGLPTGECRPLSRHEVDLLRQAASGAAVTGPRYFESALANRPPRDSHRGRERVRPRVRRDDNSVQVQQPHQGSQRDGPQSGSAPARPRRGRPAPSEALGRPRPRIPQGRPAGASPQLGAARKPRPPVESGGAASATPLQPRPIPTRRRVIGLEQQPATGMGVVTPGRPSRKRPAGRRPPGPGAGLRRKPKLPSEPGSPHGKGA